MCIYIVHMKINILNNEWWGKKKTKRKEQIDVFKRIVDVNTNRIHYVKEKGKDKDK